MVTKAQKIRLGIFIAIGALLLIIFAAAVAGSRLVQKRDYYYIEFSDYSVSGLQVGGSVNYSGIRIGRVEEIRIDPDDVSKIIITISVTAGTPIKEDAEAVLTAVGITGLKAVEIRGGTNQAKKLKNRSFIKTGTSMLDNITDKAVSIAEKVDVIAENIAQMTAKENRENIAEILKQASLLLQETRLNLTSTISNISRIAEQAVEISSSAGANISRLTDTVISTIDEVKVSSTQTIEKIGDSTTRNMDSLTRTTEDSISKISLSATKGIDGIAKSLTDEIVGLSANLNKSINDLNQQTSLLMQDTRAHINAIGTHSDELIVQTTQQIMTISETINSSLNRINQIVSSPAFDSLVVNVSSLSAQLAKADLQNLVAELSSTVSKAGVLISNLDRTVTRSRSNITETLESLRETAENLNEFSKQISDNPSLLLRGY